MSSGTTLFATRGNAPSVAFQVPDFRREALLREEGAIAAFADADRARRPWLHRAFTGTLER